MSKLQDVKAILHLFAGLMAQPERISQKEFKMDEHDFPEPFHKIVFGAINNLHLSGAEKISPVDIDGLLSTYSAQYATFNSNNGLDYLFKLEDIGEPENFHYYHSRVKKFTFLRECKKVGIDVTDIYDPNVVDLKEQKEQNDRFNELKLGDMVRHVEMKMIEIKEKFVLEQSFQGSHISKNLREIVESKKEAPSYGAPFASQYLNTIFRGGRKKKFILKHGNTGEGKSRMGIANICAKCIPELWNHDKKQWVQTGANGSGLVINTELEEEEVKMPFACYVAGVSEEKVNACTMTLDEEERIDKAIDILERSNIWFEVLEDFDIDDIETVIVKNINKNNVDFIEFDYIHMSLKLLTSLSDKGIKNLREDQVLLIMGIALKNLCNKYDIHIESATQLNDNQNLNDNMDQSWIRGSKALADKIDGGYIILPIREKDLKVLEAIRMSGAINNFGLEPNITLNVYKNRGNKWKRVRVWGHFNLDSLRFTDLFCTNYKGELIDIQPLNIIMQQPEPTEEQTSDLPASFDF